MMINHIQALQAIHTTVLIVCMEGERNVKSQEEENHVGKHAVKQKENLVKENVKGKQKEEDKFLK